MASGFFLGGLAQGFGNQQRTNIAQQQADQSYDLGTKRLQIEQQSQQMAQQRFQQSRMDEIRSKAMDDVTYAIKQMKSNGANDAQIQKAIAPWVDQLRQNAKLSGLDASAVDIRINSALSSPAFNGAKFASLISGASDTYGVPQEILQNLLQQESGMNPNAVSSKGAQGVAQFMPGTAKDRGVQPFNPDSAIPGAASYLSDLSKQFNGNWGLALAAYNWGPGNVQKWVQSGADPKKLPKETASYVEAITGKPVEQWTGQQPQGQPAQPNPQQEVNRLTQAMIMLPPDAPASAKEAIKMRLQAAIEQNRPNVSVHFAKTEDGNEVPVFIDTKNKTATDANGNPYVTPSSQGGTDSAAIGDAIMSGKQPPVLTGLYRNAKGVRAYLGRKDFDLTRAQLEWTSAQKQIQSLNGPQMVRYSGLANSVVNTIDEVNRLAEQVQNSGIPALNAIKLKTYIQTQGNSPNGQLAAKYLAAVGTLKEEFANLANGGYAPTEPAWKLAEQQINGDYGVQQLSASLGEVQRLIRYRLQGIPNFQTLGSPGQNRYVGGSGQGADHSAPSPATPSASGTSGGIKWSIEP